MNTIPFAFSIHPGVILRTEFMEPLGLTAYRLAKDLHISAPRVNDLIRGKRGITADTALRLSRYFGNSAQFWIGLQSGHDLWAASREKSWSKVKPRERAARARAHSSRMKPRDEWGTAPMSMNGSPAPREFQVRVGYTRIISATRSF